MGTAKSPELKENEYYSKIKMKINVRLGSIKVPDSFTGINWNKYIQNRKSSKRTRIEYSF